MLQTIIPAWHYTTGQRYKAVCENGVIRPSTPQNPAGELPIVWFSTHPYWEPTVPKGASMDEVLQLGGLVRLGVDRSALLPWTRLRNAARIPTHVAERLELVGRMAGANPADWYGSIEPVFLEDVVIVDVMEGEHWARVRPRVAE